MVVEMDGRRGSEDGKDRRLMREDVAIGRDQRGTLQARAETRPVACLCGPMRG